MINININWNIFSSLNLAVKKYPNKNSISKSIFSSTLYNFAYLSVKANVMKEYNIDILFKINSDFEVIIQ